MILFNYQKKRRIKGKSKKEVQSNEIRIFSQWEPYRIRRISEGRWWRWKAEIHNEWTQKKNTKTGGIVQKEHKVPNSQTMKVEGVDNEITGNSLKARSKENSSIGLLFLCFSIERN